MPERVGKPGVSGPEGKLPPPDVPLPQAKGRPPFAKRELRSRPCPPAGGAGSSGAVQVEAQGGQPPWGISAVKVMTPSA